MDFTEVIRMANRKRKKTLKLRGRRTHGKGNTKNNRGKGRTAGKGNAGFFRSKWTWTVVYDPQRFGKYGFHSIRSGTPTITLEEINCMILGKKIVKQGDKYELQFPGKVLGTGKIAFPLKLRAKQITEGAKKKIEEANGEIELQAHDHQKQEQNE